MRYPTDPPCSPRERMLAHAEERPVRESPVWDDAPEYADEGACGPCGHDVEHHGPRGCGVRGCRCERRGAS